MESENGMNVLETATRELEFEKLVEQNKQRRAQEFAADLEQLLKKHRCKLLPVITLEGTTVQAGFRVIAL